MQLIPLTQGKYAQVSDGDYAELARYAWQYLKNDRKGYAVRQERRADGSRAMVYMHRQIMGAEAGELVDHEDGDGLNNQRENLRIATFVQNGANRPAPERAIPYRGVYANKPGRALPFRTTIKAFQRSYELGAYPTQEAAARAYDRAALHFFGPFARLNFPAESEATRALPLPATIAKRMNVQYELPLAGDAPELPEIASSGMGHGEARMLASWRSNRIFFNRPPANADDDLL